MEIVQFKNGNYGIRKRSILDLILNNKGKFMDFDSPSNKFIYEDSVFFNDCQLDSLEKVHAKIDEIIKENDLNKKPLVIKVIEEIRL